MSQNMPSPLSRKPRPDQMVPRRGIPTPTIEYYLLTLPAVFLQIYFAIIVFNGINSLIGMLWWLGDFAIPAAIVLPWILPLVSVYALLTLRSSTMLTVLTTSFFLYATGTGDTSIFTVVFVVAAFFASLVGFNHAREAKLLSGKRPTLTIEGDLEWMKMLNLGIEGVLPFVAALGLVGVVAFTLAIMRERVAIMPQPLSTLGTAYFNSHVNLIFLVITVAGMTVWAARQIFEPIMIWYSWTSKDALEEAQSTIQRDYNSLWKRLHWKPGRTVSRPAYLMLLFVGLFLGTMGPQGVAESFISILTLGSVNPAGHASSFESSFGGTIRELDHWLAQASAWLNSLAKLLWG